MGSENQGCSSKGRSQRELPSLSISLSVGSVEMSNEAALTTHRVKGTDRKEERLGGREVRLDYLEGGP